MTLPPPSNQLPEPKPPLSNHRRAALLMFAIGGLLSVLGLCGFVSVVLQDDQTTRDAAATAQRWMNTPDPIAFSPATLRNVDAVIAMAMLIGGLAIVALGSGVRSGNQPAVIASITISSALVLVGGLIAAATGIVGLAAPPVLACACGMFIPVALSVLLLIWLIMAARSSRAVSKWNAQQALQFMQSQLAAEKFSTGRYGYGPPQVSPTPDADKQPQDQQ